AAGAPRVAARADAGVGVQVEPPPAARLPGQPFRPGDVDRVRALEQREPAAADGDRDDTARRQLVPGRLEGPARAYRDAVGADLERIRAAREPAAHERDVAGPEVEGTRGAGGRWGDAPDLPDRPAA